MHSPSPQSGRSAAIIEPALQRSVELGHLTTFGVGGAADLYTAPTTTDELAQAIRWARAEDMPWFVLGTGANILIQDGGIEGLVIHNRVAGTTWNDHRLTTGSGAIFADLIIDAASQSMSGLEHYVGIPSSVGGALWQNLHFLSPDRTRTMFIEEVVESATVLFDDDTIGTVDCDWFEFGYDDSVLHHYDHIVLDATFALTPAAQDGILETMWRNAAWRAEKHPFGAVRCSAGSIFQKIEGIGAGRLIDQAGLKGFSIGGAQVSDHHANFILNTGDATATDVTDLIAHVQDVVERESGHRLEPEISLVGRP